MFDVQNLTVQIAALTVCEKLNMHLAPGEICGVLGQNGVGKTTLLNTLAGLRAPVSGSITLNDRALHDYDDRSRAQHISVLFQHSVQSFPATVLDTVLIGRHPHIGRWQWESSNDLEIARGALRDVGLQDYEQRKVDFLSGGERRRLDLATLLTQDTSLMFLDEPFNHLDLRYQVAISDVLKKRVRDQQKMLVVVMHDINLAQGFCDRLLMLYGDGKVAQGETTAMLTRDRLSDLYQCRINQYTDEQGRVMFTAGG